MISDVAQRVKKAGMERRREIFTSKKNRCNNAEMQTMTVKLRRGVLT